MSSEATNDKEERIRNRRQKISTALAAKKAGHSDGKSLQQKDTNSVVSGGQLQVVDSRARLDKLKTDGLDGVTHVRIDTDFHENERRINEEQNKDTRFQRLQDEAATSSKRNAAIAMKWNSLYERNMPQDLLREIQQQKDACDRVVASKDRIIKEFQMELRAKDEEYVKSLKKQAQDIDSLLDTMHEQTRALQRAYEHELRAIEDAFLKERSELLSANRDEINKLLDKRRDLEIAYQKKRADQYEQHQSDMDAMRESYAETFANNKMKLQTEIHDLENQLEEMRARYQLNAEKLEYNHRVLQERVQENKAIIDQHKRKTARLQDSLSSVMTKYAKIEKKAKAENNELTEQFKRMTEQFKDLQNKFRYFQQADVKKYEDIFAMNREAVEDLASKVLEADKVIFEQQLGIEWLTYTPEDFSERPVMTTASIGGHTSSFRADNTNSALRRSQAKSAASRSGGGGGAFNDVETSSVTSSSPTHKSPSRASSARIAHTAGTNAGVAFMEEGVERQAVKKMFELLCDEAGFMIDERVATAMATLPQEEQQVAKASSILRALGVESHEDVRRLLRFFYRSANKAGALDPATSSVLYRSQQVADDRDRDDADDGDDPENRIEDILIPASDVTKAIRAFVEEQQWTNGQASKRVVLSSVPEQSTAQRKMQEKEFWLKIARPIPPPTRRLWGSLENWLEKYNALLTSRSKLVEETDSLAQQNMELKGLLSQYLSSKINEELHVPPTAVLNGQ